MNDTAVTARPKGLSLSDRWNSPFPFYLNDEKKNALLVLAISAFVTVFLYAFKTPVEAGFPGGLEWLHGIITLVCLSFNILLLPRIFPAAMDPVRWTIGKYVYINLGHLLLIGIVTTIVEKALFCPDKTWFLVANHVSFQVALKGIIPIVLTTLFLKTVMLKENLDAALQINQELGKIRALKAEQPRSANQVTLYSDTTDSMTFNLPDLLFIEADDNYCTVFWKEQADVKKRLLRVNLKSLESQLNNSFALRCHRSYIVNVNAISAVSGNANGYRLKVNGSEFAVPVSRQKGREVMEKISQLRNLMELTA